MLSSTGFFLFCFSKNIYIIQHSVQASSVGWGLGLGVCQDVCAAGMLLMEAWKRALGVHVSPPISAFFSLRSRSSFHDMTLSG